MLNLSCKFGFVKFRHTKYSE